MADAAAETDAGIKRQETDANPSVDSTCMQVEALCGKAQNLILEMSAVVTPPPLQARTDLAGRTHGPIIPHRGQQVVSGSAFSHAHVLSTDTHIAVSRAGVAAGGMFFGSANLEEDLAELRSRVSRVELRLGQRGDSSLVEGHSETASLRKELWQLERGLADALRELSETKNQVRALQQQMGMAVFSKSHSEVAGASDIHATPTQVLTPSFPRTSMSAAAKSATGSSRQFPTSPDSYPGEVFDSKGQVWVSTPHMSCAASSELGVGVTSGRGTAESLDKALDTQSTPTQLLTPSYPRPPMIQTGSGSIGTVRACLSSPPETARPGHLPSHLPAPVALGVAARTCTPVPQLSCRTVGQPQHFQPTPRTGSTSPSGLHMCHTPIRGGACHRPTGQGAVTPIYPARHMCVRGGA